MRRSCRSRRRNTRLDVRSFLNVLKKVLICATGVLALYSFSQSPFFALKDIKVQGLKRLSLAEVSKVSGLSRGTNLFRIDLDLVEKRLLAHPLIEQVEARRRFPRTVLIKISEREPRALLLVNDGFLVLDKKGFCIDRLASSLGSYSLPIITGLTPDSTALGERVSRNGDLAAVLRALEAEVQPFFSEVNLADSDRITGYSREGIPILLGTSQDLLAKFRLAVSLAGSLRNGQPVEYIDLTAIQAPAVKYLENETGSKEKMLRRKGNLDLR